MMRTRVSILSYCTMRTRALRLSAIWFALIGSCLLINVKQFQHQSLIPACCEETRFLHAFHSTPNSIIVKKPNNVTNATRWETSSVLPEWMKDYFDWHQDQLANHLSNENWASHRYLVIRCLESEVCGGASDRLSSIPKYVRVASMSKRLLFIKWTRPAPLEEFLVPPVGGMNWSVPAWLDPLLDYKSGPRITGRNSKLLLSDKCLVIARDQSHDHGLHFYNQERELENEAGFDEVFRDVWNVLFTPAPPVQALIDDNMHQLSLVPGQYIAVHVRSMYKSDQSNDQAMINNSINCASMLKPGWPIYFASDSTNTTKNAIQYAKSKNASIVYRKTESEPLHLDRGGKFLKRSNGWRNNTAFDFYSVFVDLYLLADSGCSSFGVGGFGKWGSRLSYNSSCHVQHSESRCPWTTTATTTDVA